MPENRLTGMCLAHSTIAASIRSSISASSEALIKLPEPLGSTASVALADGDVVGVDLGDSIACLQN